ncbi:MAG: cation-transporting P-type ATPase [Gammaproteobacteria bacterium]|uniref:cation-transporting P-type ATPase n=1 Tax=Pseudomaricurvus alcaniphilus TaxID=1166482 RepID=UPI00140AC68E|nr:cation-transporting P-type ATPase [Pseudomaricurvus alcaniphilus]MBR9912304.1 cation-transporting P-type ATPase [Gammaproteobacteria bacterium]NHN39337.1 cation-transporting P-type ATPase [Pseudomaricurvus alcaniphilus]
MQKAVEQTEQQRKDQGGVSAQWHAMDAEAVLAQLHASERGLAEEEVQRRQQQYGFNRLPEVKGRGPLLRFLAQFHNVLIYVLMVAAVITAMLQHWVDASVIFGVVLINSIIGFIQEGKAENALRAIRQMLSPNAMVIRAGKQSLVPAELLVPGDIVSMQSGDKVPADLRLIRLKGLQIQEAALTGESVAVSKDNNPAAANAVLGDQRCMAFSGTLVTHGQGIGVVVATGSKTQIGRISKMVAGVSNVTTPLLRQLAQFGHWLTIGILVVAAANFAFGVWIHDYLPTEMFLASVSLAVAAIPEGLPAIMTITLAIGVQRMAKRNAIIRKLPAVETLGSVSVICSDKTGTLTRNEMTVGAIATSQHRFDVSGTGYDPHGDISLDSDPVDVEHKPLLHEALRGAVLCNDASLESKDGEWKVNGDPMEGALLVAGQKAGLDLQLEAKNYPRTDLIPFESEHRFMATLHHSHSGEAFIYLKGAPERVLDMCATQRDYSGEQSLERQYWLDRIEEMAAMGLRVLAIAMKTVPAEQVELKFADVEQGLTLLGFFGLSDPPRSEAIESVRKCTQAGITVKMITGDHGATALAIAKQLGLKNSRDVLTGKDLEAMNEAQLRDRIEDVDVYARVNPEHKLLLVRLLQEQGQVVAMTGDGVNDAPALKRADVGTAMGKNGTEAAKEAAEMVLGDDNFASITHAVEEGRTVYDNITKSILFILPTNGGEALIILGAVIMGFQQLPLTPVQILWVNMITAVTLALALAFEPAEKNVMRRPPRDTKQPILSLYLFWRVVFVSIILMVGTFGIYLWDLNQGATIEHARTAAVNTLVMFEIFYLFNARYITESVFNWEGLTGNRYVLVAIAVLVSLQMVFTYASPFQLLFGTADLEPGVWITIVLVAVSVLLLVELEKWVVRSRRGKARAKVPA